VLQCNEHATVQLKIGSRMQTVHIIQVRFLLKEPQMSLHNETLPSLKMTLTRTIWSPVR